MAPTGHSGRHRPQLMHTSGSMIMNGWPWYSPGGMHSTVQTVAQTPYRSPRHLSIITYDITFLLRLCVRQASTLKHQVRIGVAHALHLADRRENDGELLARLGVHEGDNVVLARDLIDHPH